MCTIKVNDVSKIYKLYKKPSDRLKEALIRKPLHTPFASLSNVSFSVSSGESVGIIGDNGAGKSTILKILAGTLTATSGQLRTRGRVAALLELGAGFHHEFTGRQNLWMNASLMGLSRDEILANESRIIDFSELGDFIDRPIKTYSSGMVIRLAFSIATSVEPDILIIDEALSVGDHYFQKKCIDRMLEFKNSNKTILFCSHAMFTVNQLCDRALWFDNGQIREAGKATHITAIYENYNREKGLVKEKADEENSPCAPDETSENNIESSQTLTLESNNAISTTVTAIRLNGSADSIDIHQGDDLEIEIAYKSTNEIPFFIAAGIRRNDDLVCHAANMAKQWNEPLQGKRDGIMTLRYRKLPFLHGVFSVVAFIMDDSGLQCYHKKESATFTVLPQDLWENEIGLLKLEHDWCLT